MRFLMCFLLAGFLGFGSLASEAAAPAKLRGTFIQFQTWMLKMSRSEWNRELESMRLAGVETIVLQWLKLDTKRFFPTNMVAEDAIADILDYADAHGMKVLVGLGFDNEWWKRWDEPEWLRRMANKNTRFARQIWERYGRHTSFAGWYIPFEISDEDFDDDEIEEFRGFLRRMSDACHDLSGRKSPVAISFFFQGSYTPEESGALFERILKGSGVQLVLIQDGVGANEWAAKLADTVVPYLQAIGAAAARAGAKTWAVLELFSNVRNKAGNVVERVPGEIGLVRNQLNAEAPYAEKIIGFDMFHYMSPHRNAASKKLYDAFVSQVGR